jgi:hypothetical protein
MELRLPIAPDGRFRFNGSGRHGARTGIHRLDIRRRQSGNGSEQPWERKLQRCRWRLSSDFTVPAQRFFSGSTFLRDQTARQDLDQALDVLFNHPNVGPFVSRQLILQFVTSNPSPGVWPRYRECVQQQRPRRPRRSHLRDSRRPAASGSGNSDTDVGQADGAGAIRGLTASRAERDRHRPSVHERQVGRNGTTGFLSTFRVQLLLAGIQNPRNNSGRTEFQILTAVTALVRTNFVGALIGGRFGEDVAIDYTPFTSRANDPAALVDYCNLLLMGGQMSLEQRAEIIKAVRVSPATRPSERVRTALYLTLSAAQFQVDR